MRTVNLQQDIEQVLIECVISMPDVFLSYEIDAVDVVYHRDGYWDVVYVESEETEVVIGKIELLGDFDAKIDIFDVSLPILDIT